MPWLIITLMIQSHSGDKPIEILLVEDAPGDVRLVFEAFKKATLETHLNVVNDGVGALDYLYQRGPHGNAKRPDLILLDLNLPKMNGHEVLRQIKNDPNLRRIPVVVLTSSNTEADVLNAYDAHANCYLLKPTDLKDFFNLIRGLEEFWFSLVKLPL